jgi:hypothetical protein
VAGVNIHIRGSVFHGFLFAPLNDFCLALLVVRFSCNACTIFVYNSSFHIVIIHIHGSVIVGMLLFAPLYDVSV